MPDSLKCPVCDGEMRRWDHSKYDLARCVSCDTIGQKLPNGVVRILNKVFDAVNVGDDRAEKLMAAVSSPRVTSLRSSLEEDERTYTAVTMELGQRLGARRAEMARLEQRLQIVKSRLVELAVASPEIAEVIPPLDEAMDMVSTAPSRQRGIRREDG